MKIYVNLFLYTEYYIYNYVYCGVIFSLKKRFFSSDESTIRIIYEVQTIFPPFLVLSEFVSWCLNRRRIPIVKVDAPPRDSHGNLSTNTFSVHLYIMSTPTLHLFIIRFVTSFYIEYWKLWTIFEVYRLNRIIYILFV